MPTLVEALILGFLHVRPLTSYELNKSLEQLSAHHLRVSYGTLHPALQRMNRRGWLVSEAVVEGGRSKRRYTLADPGRGQFGQWIRSPDDVGHSESALLVRLFFLGLVPADDRATIVAEMRRIADDIADSLAGQQEAARARAAEVDPALADLVASQLATLSYGIDHHRFVSAWLDEHYPTKGAQ